MEKQRHAVETVENIRGLLESLAFLIRETEKNGEPEISCFLNSVYSKISESVHQGLARDKLSDLLNLAILLDKLPNDRTFISGFVRRAFELEKLRAVAN